MTPEDARTLLDDLREETARLRDPAELQFVGGDPSADDAAAQVLAQQLAQVPGLRAQAPALAADAGVPIDDVLAVLADHESAARNALSHLRRGEAPVVARRTQVAPAAGEAPSATAGLGAALPEPSWGRGAAVAVGVLVVVLVVVLAVVLL